MLNSQIRQSARSWFHSSLWQRAVGRSGLDARYIALLHLKCKSDETSMVRLLVLLFLWQRAVGYRAVGRITLRF